MKDDIVIVSAARTPVGAFNGAFAAIPAHELGKVAVGHFGRAAWEAIDPTRSAGNFPVSAALFQVPMQLATKESGEAAVAEAVRSGLEPFAAGEGRIVLDGWFRALMATA